MDVQTGLICVALVVISAAFIIFVSMFHIKGKTYEEAIAEQRKLSDDPLLGKREKSKEKKHKNKAGGKKVKEKKEEKEDKDEDKTDHVQFEDNPQILTDEIPPQDEKNSKGNKKKGKIEKVKPILVNRDEPVALTPEFSPSQSQPEETNHFNLTQPKDDLELIRSQSRENLQQLTQSEPVINKSPKDTPTKSKKNVKEQPKKTVVELKEEKKEVAVVSNALQQQPQPQQQQQQQQVVKEIPKDVKEQPKDTPVKAAKEFTKEVPPSVQLLAKETKNKKKKNDILAQIGGDRDGVNISLVAALVRKAELSRSEIQILIDQLLNKECDNSLEHSEWTEGRTDQLIKLKKQLAEKEKALADEQEASVAFQNKLKELRVELNTEKSRLSASVRQLEETLSAKVTEAQTLHTRMQHILESHAAEKQGFVRQIEQLQTKLNENVTIIHKMQEDQGQTQGHLQQELIAQRKQMDVQFSQMKDNENALKAQLAQKHAEIQELQNVNITVTQEAQMLQSTCENHTGDIDLLRQQLRMMQDQIRHSEGQLQHYQEAGERLQDMARQLEESHRTRSDFEHRLQNAHRYEQELQKQISSLKSELNVAKNGAADAANLRAELNDLKQSQSNLIHAQGELKNSQSNASRVQEHLEAVQSDLKRSESEFLKAHNKLQDVEAELSKVQSELTKTRTELSSTQEELKNSHQTIAELKRLTAEVDRLRYSQNNSSDSQIEITRLQEENNKLSSQFTAVAELQKEINKLREENDSLTSQLAVNTERLAGDGRENGIEAKAVKSNVQLIEQNNLLTETRGSLHELEAKVTQKDTELSKLTNELETLQNTSRSQITHLRDELEVQKTKNNELRTKNWKVMEALSAAESRANSISRIAIDDLSQRARLEEQKSTEAFLQRIFPDISISESSHDKWLKKFEQKVSSLLGELKENKNSSQVVDNYLEKQNESLQGMVVHYQQIIDDTEGMLEKLQSRVESKEAKWQVQLQQREETLATLKTELDDLRIKSRDNEELKQKVSDLQTRLREAEAFRDRTQTELASLKTRHEPSHVKGDKTQNFNEFEQLGEEKSRLLQALQSEANSKASLDAEVTRLRSLLNTTESSLAEEKNLVSQLRQEVSQLKNEVYGGCSSSDQSTVNGPPLSDPSKSESTAVAQSLLAALEKTLKNTELEKCPVTEPTDLSKCDREPDTSFLISKTSPQTCHTIDHNTQASWNPLNGQQHKKHKKKRKGGSGKK